MPMFQYQICSYRPTRCWVIFLDIDIRTQSSSCCIFTLVIEECQRYLIDRCVSSCAVGPHVRTLHARTALGKCCPLHDACCCSWPTCGVHGQRVSVMVAMKERPSFYPTIVFPPSVCAQYAILGRSSEAISSVIKKIQQLNSGW